MSTAHTATPHAAQVTAAAAAAPACPACGATARRAAARYCATCGRGLRDIDYLPTDTLRASYHHQQRHPPFMPGHARHRTCIMRPQPRMPDKNGAHTQAQGAPQLNKATQLARAFVIYALVPYLGILFCPGAVAFGVVGLWRAHRAGQHNSTRAARNSVALGLFLFGAQAFLWSLLFRYK